MFINLLVVRLQKAGGVLKTSGPVPHPTALESVKQRRDSTDISDLQRSLEMEIATHLREQNAKLLAELEELRKPHPPSGSMSSWSEVETGDVGIPTVGEQPHVKRECMTPRGARGNMNASQARFTPGGTRVPDGTPPTEETKVDAPNPPPTAPPFPGTETLTGDLDQFSAGYEKKVDQGKVKRGDRTWN